MAFPDSNMHSLERKREVIIRIKSSVILGVLVFLALGSFSTQNRGSESFATSL
jgi:hypothetical protein